MGPRPVIAVLLLTCGLAVGCGSDPAPEVDTDAPSDLTVASEAFDDGEEIPVRYTCDGEEVSPPLAWSGGSSRPAAWALVVDDPDAPDGSFVHWVVVDISSSTHAVAEGDVPAGGIELTNSADNLGWTGPCPPSGPHHYRFTVYGLSERTGLTEDASLDDALARIGNTAVAKGRLVGTYRHTS